MATDAPHPDPPRVEDNNAPGAIRAIPSRRRILFSTVLAWAALLAAFLLPPHGSGVPVCPSKLMTGVPCPGCGLTRSVTCLAHADPAWSWAYHPFGVVAFLVIAWYGVVPPVAPRLHERVSRSRAARSIGLALLGAFLLHGLVRAGMWISGDYSPAGGG